MRKLLAGLIVLSTAGCAIMGGPLDPSGDPTPSGAETMPAPDPLAGTIVTERNPLDAGDLGRARSTMQRIEEIGALLADYHARHGRYPAADSSRDLVAILGASPTDVQLTDAWERPIRYELRGDGSSYVLVSAGADGEVITEEWETSATLSDPAQDLVYRDGRWVRRWP